MTNFFEGEDWIFSKLELDKFGFKISVVFLLFGFWVCFIIKEYRDICLSVYGMIYLCANIINFYIWKNRFKISYALYLTLRVQNLLYISFIGLLGLIGGSYKYYQNLGVALFVLTMVLFFIVFFLGLKRMDLIEESQLLKSKKLDYEAGTVNITIGAHTDHEWGEVMWIPNFFCFKFH